MTMQDVAEEAGFSVNTVSRAINDRPEISSDTKQKILEVANELGYRPNRPAQRLRSDKTGTIGVVVADIANPFFSELVKGIEETARKDGFSLILQDTNEDCQIEMDAVEMLMAERVDGVLISPTQYDKKALLELDKYGIPFVLLARYFDDLETHYVIPDDVKGGYLATSHLLNLGHERIAFLNGPTHISSAKDRLKGYRKALSESEEVEFDSTLIREDVLTMDEGYRVATSLLKETAPDYPSGIFAYSDFVALGVIKAIRKLKLRIPEDIALVGYDNVSFSSCLEVPLTSIDIHKYMLGKYGFQTLKRIIFEDNGGDALRKLERDVDLIPRASTTK